MQVVRPWTVEQDETTILTLDFDADEFVIIDDQGQVLVRPILMLEITKGERP